MFRSEFRAHRGYWMTLALVSAGIIGSAIGAHTAPSNGLGVSDAEESIPRCVNDDFNDGTQDICYSVRVDGAVFVLSGDDEVVSVGEEELANPAGAN